jgi:hypothetical protein
MALSTFKKKYLQFNVVHNAWAIRMNPNPAGKLHFVKLCFNNIFNDATPVQKKIF